jgi:hypothetical protein
VIEVGFVHLEQVGIAAEDNGDFTNTLSVGASKLFDPRADFSALRAAKCVVGIVKV